MPRRVAAVNAVLILVVESYKDLTYLKYIIQYLKIYRYEKDYRRLLQKIK